jgi:hypothetical protein
MESHILQLSVVIAGAENNPTLLNPDFLRFNNIVPEEWGWTLSAPPLSTPPFAQVMYDCGVAISVDPGKIQIIDSGLAPNVKNTRILDIAKAYVNVLRHVNYSATGLNFTAFIPHDNPGSFLKERFICKGTWDSTSYPLDEVGLRFVYQLEGVKVNVAIDAGEVSSPLADGIQGSLAPQTSIVANLNFHRDCIGNYPKRVDEVLQHLEWASNDADQFSALMHQILMSD